MATAKSKSTGKRKRVVLSIDEKMEILKLIDKDVSYSIIMDKYGIGRSTVSDIKKNKDSIMAFKRQAAEMGMVKKAKSMKIGKDEGLDQAVFVWFNQKRAEGVPISGSILCEKAVQLSGLLGNSNFKASSGWRWRFCKRHVVSENFLYKVKNSLQTRMLLISSFQNLRKCVKRNVYHFIKYSIAMKLG